MAVTDFYPDSIFITESLFDDEDLMQAAKSFNVPVKNLPTSSALNYITNKSVVVLEEFEGSIFELLRKSKRIVLGPTALLESSEKKSLSLHNLQTYSLSMNNVTAYISNYEAGSKISVIRKLISYMGGKVKKHLDEDVTHLILYSCRDEIYSFALVHDIPIMSEEWVITCWKKRKKLNFSACSEKMMKLTVNMFSGIHFCFHGFSDEVYLHLSAVAEANGGRVVQMDDKLCTHIVTNELNEEMKYPKTSSQVIVTDSAWFWRILRQNVFEEPDKFYLQSTLAHKNMFHKSPHAAKVKHLLKCDEDCGVLKNSAVKKNLVRSKRQEIINELISTEASYISVLDLLLKIKDEVLDVSQTGGPLLTSVESKLIFGNLQTICDLHKAMFEELENETTICDTLLKIGQDIQDEYTQFIQFFETSRLMLEQCNKTNQRFSAFLQGLKLRKECNKQSLIELLIRPIQRLPSICLIIKRLFEETPSDSIEHEKIEKAISQIELVLSQLNENKRNAESLVAIFEVFNSIKGCPANLISSGRKFICQFEAIQLDGNLGKQGDVGAFFIFSDIIEICKVKTSTKTLENPPKVFTKNKGYIYRHLKVLCLTAIQMIINVTSINGQDNIFCLIVETEKGQMQCTLQMERNYIKTEMLMALAHQVSLCSNKIKEQLLYEMELDMIGLHLQLQ